VELRSPAGEKLEEQSRTARGAANDAREAFVGRVLELRKLADSVNSAYSKLATDPEVSAAIASLNAASGKTFSSTPSRDFASAERRLVQLEDTVLSESIPLRREGGESLWVPVVINGKHTKEMIVDSGSSMICLPRKIAKECGIEVGSQHQEITLVLADGSRIQAHEVPLDSVRVGKFTVENVVCAVLGEEAIEADPLLGMSFLGQFKWELDSENKLLKMVKVESGKTGGN
jgi:aspartyl protease family protein